MDLVVQGYSLCGVVWYRTLRARVVAVLLDMIVTVSFWRQRS